MRKTEPQLRKFIIITRGLGATLLIWANNHHLQDLWIYTWTFKLSLFLHLQKFGLINYHLRILPFEYDCSFQLKKYPRIWKEYIFQVYMAIWYEFYYTPLGFMIHRQENLKCHTLIGLNMAHYCRIYLYVRLVRINFHQFGRCFA